VKLLPDWEIEFKNENNADLVNIMALADSGGDFFVNIVVENECENASVNITPTQAYDMAMFILKRMKKHMKETDVMERTACNESNDEDTLTLQIIRDILTEDE
jgi:hypothetical protein